MIKICTSRSIFHYVSIHIRTINFVQSISLHLSVLSGWQNHPFHDGSIPFHYQIGNIYKQNRYFYHHLYPSLDLLYSAPQTCAFILCHSHFWYVDYVVYSSRRRTSYVSVTTFWTPFDCRFTPSVIHFLILGIFLVRKWQWSLISYWDKRVPIVLAR